MNLKKTLLIFGFPLMLAITMPLYAQTGCADSPEDPTIVLALVGVAAMVVASVRKSREAGNRE
jgi:XrtJ-associated TM-motif-TM protein